MRAAMWAAMRAAVGFLTVVGGSARPDDRAAAWFAPVGAAVGLAVGGVWWAAGEAWDPLVAAVLAVAADAALTGLLHLDGLADTADGLLPPLDRSRRLAVMSTPDVGAFGVAVVVLTLLLRVAALASLAPDPLLVAGLWAASRAAMALTLATVPYARPTGLATAFVGVQGASAEAGPDASTTPVAHRRRRAGGRGHVLAAVGGLVGGGALAVGAGGWLPGSAAVLGLAVAFAGVVGLARRRLGGFTGDVLGAAGVVGETVGLVLAAARW
jgi:adenosylcobinamide-GDP ribazoletransferase